MQKLLLGVLFYIASFGANAGPSPDAFSAFTITLAQKSVVDDPSAPYGFDISFVVSGSAGLKLQSANLQIDNSPQGCINDAGGVGNGNLRGTSGQYESTDFVSGGLNAGTYTITLSIYGDEDCLGTEGEASGSITIESRASNDAPSATNDTGAVNEDATLTVAATGVLADDTDADGDALTVSAIAITSGAAGTIGAALSGTYGDLTIASDGSYTYVANNANSLATGETATDSFTYTVSDGSSTDTATLIITVTGVNDQAPVAVDDPVTLGVTEDTVYTSVTTLVANDTDADGDTLTATAGTVATGQGGSVVIATDGSYTYTPLANFSGTDTVNYTVSDSAFTDTGTLTITVAAVNDVPVAVDDSVSSGVTEGVAFNSATSLIANDTDADGDTLAATEGTFTTGQGGSIVIATDGSYTYTPATDFSGTDTVDYIVDDSNGGTAAGTLTITVSASDNNAPVAVDDTVSSGVTEDTAFNSVTSLITNDTDADNDTLAATAGTFATDQGGSIVIATNGAYTYTPGADFNGADTVSYTVVDDGGLSDTGTLTITVGAVNDAPVLTLTTSASPSFRKAGGASAGDTVVEFMTSDAEGADVTVTLSDTTNYALTSGATTVTLTSAGATIIADYVDGGASLPAFTLTPRDEALDGAAITVSPTVTAGNELPTLLLTSSARPWFVEGASADGATVVGYATIDDDDDTVSVTLSDTTNYALDTDNEVVTLTLAGLAIVDAAGSLPSFTLTPNDTFEDGAAVTVAPRVAASSAFSAVAALYDLSSQPLDIGSSAAPNVVVLADTSVSLKSDVLTSDAGGYWTDSSDTYEFIHSDSCNGNCTAPESIWQLRSKDFNKLYYNPEVRYQPWAGCEDGSVSGCGGRDAPGSSSYYYYHSEGNEVAIEAESGVTGDSSPADRLDDVSPTGFADGNALYPKFPDRTDCAGSACTLLEERTNFDLYYAWARTRGHVTKAAIGQAIFSANEQLRVGFGESNGNSNNEPIQALSVTGHRATLLSQLYTSTYQGNSQLHSGLAGAGKYLECASGGGSLFTGSPVCPVRADDQGSCQQNYVLIVTDANFEGEGSNLGNLDPGNADGDESSVFDGAVFAEGAPSGWSSTLADIAMHYYERDLFTSIDNDVVPLERDIDLAPAGTFSSASMHQHVKTYAVAFGLSSGLVDPPTAYSADAYDWGSSDAVGTAEEQASFRAKDLYHATINGRGRYFDAQSPQALSSELTAAFDEFSAGIGSGSAVSFNSQELSSGGQIFRSFYNLNDKTGDIIALAFDESFTVGSESWSAAAELDDQDFDSGRNILTFKPSLLENQGVGIPFRYDQLGDAQSDAFGDNVEDKVNYLRGERTNEQPSGDFRARLEEKGLLGPVINSSTVYVGKPDRQFRGGSAFPSGDDSYAAFVNAQAGRADRLYFSANGGKLHGVNPSDGSEQFAFVPNAAMTNASNNSIIDFLSPGYSHQYLIDATPVVDDVFMRFRTSTGDVESNKAWGTLLVGAYGAGGKGLFALDITDPVVEESDVAKVVLWEFTDQDDVYPTYQGSPILDGSGVRYLDDGSEIIKDLGLTVNEPVIALSNAKTSIDDNTLEWMALIGNGVNSSAGIAKLFALFLDRGADGIWCHPDAQYSNASLATTSLRDNCDIAEQDFTKIDTGVGGETIGGDIYPNGLGAVRAIDIDRNGTVDYAYAGDMQGNLYRFDLCLAGLPEWEPGDLYIEYSGALTECKQGASIHLDWSVQKIFTASYDDTVQPILNRPIVVENPQEGVVVVVGTGRYIVNGDNTNADVQSIYGVWDRFDSTILVLKTELEAQTFTNICGTITVGDDDVATCGRTLSSNPVGYNASPEDGEDAVLGWYIDLDLTAEGASSGVEHPGERAIRNLQIKGGIAFVNSVLPTTATACTQADGGFELSFCPLTGGSDCFGAAIFDLNNDGAFDDSDKIGSSVVAGLVIDDSRPADSAFAGTARVTQLSDQSLKISVTNTQSAANTGRLSWRRLNNEQ